MLRGIPIPPTGRNQQSLNLFRFSWAQAAPIKEAQCLAHGHGWVTSHRDPDTILGALIQLVWGHTLGPLIFIPPSLSSLLLLHLYTCIVVFLLHHSFLLPDSNSVLMKIRWISYSPKELCRHWFSKLNCQRRVGQRDPKGPILHNRGLNSIFKGDAGHFGHN